MTSVNEKSNRILFIDILRGLTLLGVMLVNAVTINGPYFLDGIDFAFKFSELDHILSGIVSFLLLEKSYPVFVFLFGLSNQLLLNKLLQTLPSQKVFKIYLKRMFVLGIIGTLHLAFFYWGDVLLTYALLGCLVGVLINYVFHNNYLKLLRFNIILIIISLIINSWIFLHINSDVLHTDPEDHFVDVLARNSKQELVIQSNQNLIPYNHHSNNNVFIKVYQEGNISSVLYFNIYSYINSFGAGLYKPVDAMIGLDSVNYFIEVLILIIFGILMANSQILKNDILNYSNKTYLACLTIAGSVFLNCEMIDSYDISSLSWIHIFNIFILINNIVLYIFIVASAYRVLSYNNLNQYLERFSAIGRMTLTWYLLHSIVMSLILFSYGFGLYGKIGVTDCILLTIIYYYCCYKISPIWLKKFKQGPIEKYWRYLTMPRNLHSI